MRVRTPTIVLFCLFALPLAGCDMTGEQRIAQLQQAVTATQQLSQQLAAKIGEFEKALADAQALAQQPGVDPAIVAKLQSDIAFLQAKLAQAKPVQQALDKQLATYQESLKVALASPIDVEAEAKLYGQGVSAVGAVLPPPFNIYVGLIGSLIGVGGGIIGAILKGRKDGKSFTGIVDSVSVLLNSPLVTDKEAAKSILAREQVKTPGAATEVRKVLDAKTA